jgi:uncharacterized protein
MPSSTNEERLPTAGPQRLRRWLVVFTVFGVLFVGGLFALRSMETRIVYPHPPADVDFAHEPFELLRIHDEKKGHTAHALFLPARESRPTFATFHGNGEQLSSMLAWLQTLERHGLGGFAIEYPGYGLSASDDPSEENVYLHAETALTHLRETLGVTPARTFLVGESLGTGVAVEMAARGHGAKLVLFSPFTSLVDVANLHAPWLPARWLMRNHYDSATKASEIPVPVLVMHGTDDGLIPANMGKTLAQLFPNAEFIALEGVGHGGMVYSYGESALDRLER